MQVIESIKLAMSSIRGSKLRSILTLLGIAVGLFSIIIVMTSISAIQKSVEDTFNSIGSSNFIIQKWPALQFGGPRSHQFRNRKDLTVEQGEKLKEITQLPLAVGISQNVSAKTIRFGNEKTNPDVAIAGVNLEYLQAFDLKVTEGRMFTKADIDYSRPVCIIGTDIVDKVLKKIYPVGQTIKIDNYNFEVIGIFEKRGSILGQSRDNFAVIPIGNFQRIYGTERTSTYVIMCRDKDLITATQDEVAGALRKIRRVGLGQENDFEIITNDQLIDQFNSITKYFKLGAGVIAFISLLAAGIGIMNIMLVSVTERTREIGIRKAIGARKINILMQFVIEAVSLSWVGGLIGILLGLIGGNLVALYLGVSVVLPMEWVIAGLFVTTFVGVVFGVYPAVKASNLDPIEALRYE
jgi:putative ABC transport system permease protein